MGGDIPDVSGFVTKTTYEQEQAAQDAKITAAQTAADKANTSIGDWDAEHPGKTIAQKVTELASGSSDWLSILDYLYPPDTAVLGASFNPTTLYPHHYDADEIVTSLELPIYVPRVVEFQPQLWNTTTGFIDSITVYNETANSEQTVKATPTVDIRKAMLSVNFNPPFHIPNKGIYYFKMNGTIIQVNWIKNDTPFTSLPT